MSTQPTRGYAVFTPWTDDQPGPTVYVDQIPLSMLHLDDTILDTDDNPIHVTAITWGPHEYVRVEGVRLSDGEPYDMAHQIEGGIVERVLDSSDEAARDAANDELVLLPEEEPLPCAAYIDGCENNAEWIIVHGAHERSLCALHLHATFSYWLTMPDIDDIRVERVK